jgi:uncharacterized membrane protein YqiK
MQQYATWIWIGGSIIGLAALVFAAIKCSGLVVIGDDEVGIITKKFSVFGPKELPAGTQFAMNGEPGLQVDTLPPGWHFFLWPWQYSVEKEKAISVREGQIGLVIAKDGKQMQNGRVLGDYVECKDFQDARSFFLNGGVKGKQSHVIRTGLFRINTRVFEVITADNIDEYNRRLPSSEQINPGSLRSLTVAPNHIGIVTTHDGLVLPEGHVAAPKNETCDAFQNIDLFFKNDGYRGLQETVIRPGTWVLNPWFVSVEVIEMTHIDTACCGVIVSYVGEAGQDVSGEDYLYSNIVENGFRGVWKDTLGPGLYAINTRIQDVHIIPTSNFVLNFSERHEDHGYDDGLGAINLRSKDGFEFEASVQQIIHVPYQVAPRLISRFGSMQKLIDNQLEPLVSNYFRNISQKHEILEFNDQREARQTSAKQYITEALRKFDVEAVDTLIGAITLPAALMKTVQDRKTADEQRATYESQASTENARAGRERAQAEADAQRNLINAQQDVLVAKQSTERLTIEANGRASVDTIAAQTKAKIAKIEADGAGEAKVAAETRDLEATKLRAEGIKVMTDATTNKIKSEGEAEMGVRRLELEVIGQNNYAAIQISKALSDSNLKLVPDIVLGAGSGSDNSVVSTFSAILAAGIASKKQAADSTEA